MNRRPDVLDSVGLAMAIVSLIVSLSLVGPLVRAAEVPLLVVVALAVAAYRGLLLARPDATSLRRYGYWGSLAASAVLTFISPVFGAYAFLGYLESGRLPRGWPRMLGLLGTAAILAAAQMGGARGYFASWPLFGLMLAINLAVVAFISVMERQRERHTDQLERTIAELQASEQRNAQLQEQLLSQAREAGVTDERQRLSREIHDTVAQQLVGIITQLEAIDPADADLSVRLDRARGAARDALAEARRAVRALASPRLDDASLPDALAGLVRQVGEATGLDASFRLDGEPAASPADSELMRIAQEALSNAIRHAVAGRVVVTLGYSDDEIRLDVRDDGRGFDPESVRSGHGLTGMQDRLTALGGSLQIESQEGEGCTISAAIPR